MLFWLAILFVLALTGWIAYKNDADRWSCVGPLIAGSLVIGIATGLTWMSLREVHGIDATRTETWHVELVSLKLGEKWEGRFFLGSGRIGSDEIYVYMYRTRSGALKRGRDNAYQCTIRETTEESPRRVFDKRFARIEWLFPWEIKLPDSAPEFRVPRGTVVSLDHYEID